MKLPEYSIKEHTAIDKINKVRGSDKYLFNKKRNIKKKTSIVHSLN